MRELEKALGLDPENAEDNAYINFLQFGRIREIAKDVDEYSLTFEHDNQLYVAISSGQTIRAEKFKHMTDDAVKHWLQLLFDIRMAFKGGDTHAANLN